MASETILAARRTQAIEDQARAFEKHAVELAEINRKLDAIMAALKLAITPLTEIPQPATDPEPAAEKAAKTTTKK
jgi:hypothetical protein